MIESILKQIDLTAKLGQDGSPLQAMNALRIIRETIANHAVVHPTRSEGERKLSDLGNELHNLSCSIVHENEEWAEQISGIARELWNWPQARAALAQPSGEVVVTKNESGAIVSVTRQDKEGRVLSVIAESATLTAQAEQAEAERPEVVAWRYGSSGGIVSDKACLDEWKSGGEYQSLMTVAQHECIVGELRAVIAQLRQHKNDYMDSGQETYRALQNEIREREAEIARLDGLVSGRTAERDAALARVADMKTMADNYCALLMDANAKLAEMERQEPVALANRGLHAFWVKWTEAAAGLYGPGIKLYTAPVAQAQHSVPEVSGIGRDTGHPRAVVLYLRKEPTDDDLRAIHDALRSLAAAPGKEVPQAWLDVQAERRRQITAEGWTPEHDDLYCAAELPRAAAAYILNGANDEAPAIWPFSAKWWKPSTARRDMVKACALALAEIERLDRAAEKEQE